MAMIPIADPLIAGNPNCIFHLLTRTMIPIAMRTIPTIKLKDIQLKRTQYPANNSNNTEDNIRCFHFLTSNSTPV